MYVSEFICSTSTSSVGVAHRTVDRSISINPYEYCILKNAFLAFLHSQGHNWSNCFASEQTLLLSAPFVKSLKEFEFGVLNWYLSCWMLRLSKEEHENGATFSVCTSKSLCNTLYMASYGVINLIHKRSTPAETFKASFQPRNPHVPTQLWCDRLQNCAIVLFKMYITWWCFNIMYSGPRLPL